MWVQLEAWLLGVCGAEGWDAAAVVRRVCAGLASLPSEKRYASTSAVSFLGTTTVAGRKKKQQMQRSGEARATAGQALIKLYLDDEAAFTSMADGRTSNTIRDAIRRRLDFDTQRVRAASLTRARLPLTCSLEG